MLNLRQSSVFAFIYSGLPRIYYSTELDCLQSFIGIYATTRQIEVKTGGKFFKKIFFSRRVMNSLSSLLALLWQYKINGILWIMDYESNRL